MAHILLVEDDRCIAVSLDKELSGEGHTVAFACNAEAAIESASRRLVDLILLDCDLLNKGAKTVCRELLLVGKRAPLLILAASHTQAANLIASGIVADDYIVRPCHSLELLVRVRVLLLKTAGGAAEVYRFGTVEFDITKAELLVEKKPRSVTPFEFRLLCAFVRRPGRVFSRDHLCRELGANSPDAVDNHVMYLRRKIEVDSKRPVYVVTVPGIGYRFDGPCNSDEDLTAY